MIEIETSDAEQIFALLHIFSTICHGLESNLESTCDNYKNLLRDKIEKEEEEMEDNEKKE